MDTRRKALLAVVAGNSIFGFSFLFSKVALQLTIPSVLLAVRFTAAFVVLNLIVAVGKLLKRKDGHARIAFSLKGKPLRYAVALAIFQPVLYFMAESYGIACTSSAFAGTIIAVIPIVGIVLDVLILHSRVTGKQVICAVCSVAGVAVTTLGATGMRSSLPGVLILLGAVMAGALFYVFSKKAGEYYNPLERTYVMFAVGSVVYLIFALIQCVGSDGGQVLRALVRPEFWGCILYLAVLSSVVAFMALNYGSSHISVSEASLFANLTTVISIGAGVLILHESFSLQQIIGALIIIGSVYIANADAAEKEAETDVWSGGMEMTNYYVTYVLESREARERYFSEIKEQGIIEKSRKEAGCIRYEYFYPAESDNEIFLWEQWESRAAQQEHTRQPHFAMLGALKEKYNVQTEILEEDQIVR